MLKLFVNSDVFSHKSEEKIKKLSSLLLGRFSSEYSSGHVKCRFEEGAARFFLKSTKELHKSEKKLVPENFSPEPYSGHINLILAELVQKNCIKDPNFFLSCPKKTY